MVVAVFPGLDDVWFFPEADCVRPVFGVVVVLVVPRPVIGVVVVLVVPATSLVGSLGSRASAAA